MPYAVSLLPNGTPIRSPYLLCINIFFGPFSLVVHPHGFFLSVINITKLERFHRAGSCAISDWLSSSLIPLILSETSLPLLRVTLINFGLSSYERAFRLPTSFPISGLARLGVKPRLCRSPGELLGPLTRSCFLLLPYGGSPCLPSLSSLEPAFLHCGVHSFLSVLLLRSPSNSPRCGSRSP